MAAITVTQITSTGVVAPTPAAASAGGDTLANDGKTMLKVVSSAGVQRTITIDAITNCNQGFDHDGGGTIEDAETKYYGPFPLAQFGASVAITYSSEAGLTVAGLRI